MNYLLASLLVLMLLVIIRAKRKLDSMHALLTELERDRLIRLREQEVEQLLKGFALK